MVPFHPLVVHFPIAFLVSAAVLYLISIFSQKKQWGEFAWILHVAGWFGLWLAFFTGNENPGSLYPGEELHEMVELHEKIGQFSLMFFGGLAVWAFLRKPFYKKSEKIIFVFLFFVFTSAIAFNAHLGGRMVYEKGAGVNPGTELINK